MKFLCDRCKTRYSIGDDRVRGKILKIRCKNCGNVITVREGMSSDPEPDPSRHKKTTGIPDVLDERHTALGDRSAPAPGERGAGGLPSVRGTGIAPNLRGIGEGADAGRSTGGASLAAREAGRGAGDAASSQNTAPGANRGAAVGGAARGAARDTAGRAGASGAVGAGAGVTAGANRGAAARDTGAGAAGAGGAAAGANRTARDSSGRIGASAASAPARGARGDAARAFGGDTAQGVGAAGGRGTASAQHESVNALNAAFASAMAQPAPAALEEEWYVSIDGEQAGPYALAEAQRWVSQQPGDAELHCWSEGFDDWLPIDKVSHFRGLRKRAAAPPPLPRVAGGAARPGLVAPQPPEETPKPLFAATMASLERAAPSAAVPGAPPVAASPAAPGAASPARTTPPLGTPIKPRGGQSSGANGVAGSAPAAISARTEIKPAARDAKSATGHDAKSGARADAGRGAKAGAGFEAKSEAGFDAKSSAAFEATSGARADAGRGAKPGAAFDAKSPGSAQPLFGDPFDASEDGDAATQLEAMPFEMAARAAAARAPDAGPSASEAALTAANLPASSTLRGMGASAAASAGAAATGPAPSTSSATGTTAPASSDFGGDDDLHIGEVSRVVKLADIARGSQSSDRVATRTTGTSPTIRTTGAAPALRTTGAAPAFRTTGALPSQLDGAPGDGGAQPTIAPVMRAHRRGLIALLVVAIALVVGVIGAVVLFVTTDEDLPGSSLGPVQSIDTLRPEDPVTHRPVGSAAPAPTTAPTVPRATPHSRPVPATGGSSQIAENPGPPVGALASDEIEDAARKHQEMTQRCYMRSQRGADAILIGEVKKIAVTLTIDRDGNVSELQLSDHAGDNLGKCLAGAIKAWKFRQSAGGTYRFSLNFVSG